MTTKLILTHEVSGLGTAGDVVEVKDGYARNYLLPRGLANAWSRGAEKEIETIRKARAKTAHDSVEAASAVREQLEGSRYTVAGHAGPAGRLFGTVTSKEIAASVKSAGGPDLDRRSIEVKQHIKTLGTHQVLVHLHEGVTAKLTLEVVPA